LAEKTERTATLADLEKMLGEPVPIEPYKMSAVLDNALPVKTFADLMAAVESLADIEYRVIGSRRFGFYRFRASADWLGLIRKSMRGKEFTENSPRGFLVNPNEPDKDKQLWLRDGEIAAQAMVLFGTLAEPKPDKLEDVLMLALRGGWIFTSLANAALETNGERAIEAAKKG
jgi:hypothetical protein